MDTRTQIARLSEDGLRDKIIIPMLNALGAYGVEKFHGPREMGKDVYFAYKDIFREHKHCCFFIKAGDITKSGKNDVGKMERHIKEAIFSKFTNPIDNITQIFIEELYFVCNGKVNREAREYLTNMFQAHQMPNMKIIDIDRLVEIIIDKLIRPFNAINGQQYLFQVENFKDFCEKISAQNYDNRQIYNTKALDSEEGKPIK